MPAPDPKVGIIPDTPETRVLLTMLNNNSKIPGVQAAARFFSSVEEFTTWIGKNRQVEETFYAFIRQDDNSYKIITNGIILSTMSDALSTLTQAVINMQQTNVSTFFQFLPMPVQEHYQADIPSGLYIAIFSTVLFIAPILCTATYYGAEFESGVRDLFTCYGLSDFVNQCRWMILSFLFLFVPSIPFAIALTGFIKINFGFILLYYLMGTLALSSFSLMVASIHPTGPMGTVTGMLVLFTFLIFIFWGYFDFMRKEELTAAKMILSIFPQALMGYMMSQIANGAAINFKTLDRGLYYPIDIGFVYFAVETVVFTIVYLLIEYFNKRKMFPPVFKWKNEKIDENDCEFIHVEKLSRVYNEDSVAINNVSFDIKIGETLAIVGPNGAGKSTLLSMLSGSGLVTNGKVMFKGVDITSNLRVIHQISGICPQDNIAIGDLKPQEWIRAICEIRNEPEFDYEDIFVALGLENQLKSRIRELSGGNKRKVCLATALVCKPPIIFLDEATSGVDFTSRTRIWSLISTLKETTIIMATHTLEECEKIADRIMVLSNGQVAALKTPTELRQDYKCGYQVEIEEQYVEELKNIMKAHELSDIEVTTNEGRGFTVLPSDDLQAITNILNEIKFPFLLSIQSLEQKIFDDIQSHELAEYEAMQAKIRRQTEGGSDSDEENAIP